MKKVRWYGNQTSIVNWENDGKEIKHLPKSAVRSPQYFFQKHISWNLISSKGSAFRIFPIGFVVDTASNCTYFEDDNEGLYLLALYNSVVASYILNILNPTINLSCGVVGKLPFIKSPINEIAPRNNINFTINGRILCFSR